MSNLQEREFIRFVYITNPNSPDILESYQDEQTDLPQIWHAISRKHLYITTPLPEHVWPYYNNVYYRGYVQFTWPISLRAVKDCFPGALWIISSTGYSQATDWVQSGGVECPVVIGEPPYETPTYSYLAPTNYDYRGSGLSRRSHQRKKGSGN